MRELGRAPLALAVTMDWPRMLPSCSHSSRSALIRLAGSMRVLMMNLSQPRVSRSSLRAMLILCVKSARLRRHRLLRSLAQTKCRSARAGRRRGDPVACQEGHRPPCQSARRNPRVVQRVPQKSSLTHRRGLSANFHFAIFNFQCARCPQSGLPPAAACSSRHGSWRIDSAAA